MIIQMRAIRGNNPLSAPLTSVQLPLIFILYNPMQMGPTIRIFIRWFLLVALFLSGCAAPASETPPAASVPTAAFTPSPSQTAFTPTVMPSPTLEPSPTALPLPTRVTANGPRPTRDPAATPEPRKSLLEQYLPRNEQVAETEHFVFFAQDGYFPVDREWWIEQSEIIYAYVSERVGAQAQNKIHVAFMQPEARACPVRGLASQETPPTVLLYADENSPRAYLLGVLAHELGHAIPHEGFPNGLPDDLSLTEGLATWASGKYWAAWKDVPSLDALIRQYIRDGEYEPIHQNVDMQGIYPWQDEAGADASEDCLARRDLLYSEWGSFLGYLIDTYGWEKAHRLFQAPEPRREGKNRIEFPTDYEGVYGKSLNQLEWEWLQALREEQGPLQ